MVAWGLSSRWVGDLIFFAGNVYSYAYTQCLDFFKQDMISQSSKEYKEDLLFVQDNTPPYVSALTKKHICNIMLGLLDVLNWPQNSPDLNAIEILWRMLQTKLQEYKLKTIEEMKNNLISLWYSIQKELCSNSVSTFNTRTRQVAENNGERYSKILEKSVKWKIRRKLLNKFIWEEKEELYNNRKIRIAYNEKV